MPSRFDGACRSEGKVLVTGAADDISNHVFRALAEDGAVSLWLDTPENGHA